MQDGAQKALANAFADYIDVSSSFYVQGGDITSTPSGTGTSHTLTAGVVCLAGEFMPLQATAGPLLQSASQVVFIVIQDTGIDAYPVPNTDGQVDYVKRQRVAVLTVGAAYPTGSFSVAMPRKTDLDMQRLKGRVVPKGGILPYFGAMTNFDATGLGLVNTPAEGWAVCNGMNGTIDMRGLVPLGATNVPNSGAPAIYEGVAAGATDAGAAIGQDDRVLAPNNLPAHTHQYSDSVVTWPSGSGVEDGGGLDPTNVNATGTSLPNVTTNDPISVRQSSRALVFIQSIL